MMGFFDRVLTIIKFTITAHKEQKKNRINKTHQKHK